MVANDDDEDDFEYECPRCKKMPQKGVFIGTRIWHVDCLVEDTVENYQKGQLTDDDVKKRLKNCDTATKKKIEVGCGWKEDVKAKSQEELVEEFNKSLAPKEIDDGIEEEEKGETGQPTSEIHDMAGVKPPAIGSIEEPSTAVETNVTAEEERVTGFSAMNIPVAQVMPARARVQQFDMTGLFKIFQEEVIVSIKTYRDLGKKNINYAKLHVELLKVIKDLL